ncbi:baseplate J/gp47 family protein [bacterium]|nr:baseplate J/gp47 family protein [bacterium]
MVKKLIDIFPPEEIEDKKLITTEEILLEEKIPGISLDIPKISLPNKKRLFFVLVAVFSFFGLLSLSKAKIEIYPKTEIVDFSTSLKVNEKTKEINLSSLSIPGQVLENTKIITEEFSSTGKTIKEGKATGIIRVYNSYSAEPQSLIATTRFVSKDGKVFRTPKKVTIPGQKIDKGEKIPGFLDVEVEAEETGEDYNIGTSTFSIPGLAGGPKYTYFYGKSFQSMSGGHKQETNQISQDDLDNAKNILEKKSKEDCKTELEGMVLVGYVLLPETLEVKVVDSGSISKAGQISDNFIFRARAECKTIVFKKEDANIFTDQYISSKIEEDKKVYGPSIEIVYDLGVIDFELGSAQFVIDTKAKIYSDINEEVLKIALKGKTFNEARFYLMGNDNIEEATVEFSPFWVSKVPKDDKNIEIKFIID